MMNTLLYKATLLFFVLFTGFGVSVGGQNSFPYFTTGNSATEFTVIPSTGGSGSAVVGANNKGVRLTTNRASQHGGVILSNLTFTTAKGFVVSFEYEMSGAQTSGFKGGDGLAMVLFDGSVANPSLGAFGSGLGYAYAEGTSSIYKKPGFSKGYMAVALDYYGNFHRRRDQGDDARNGVELGTDEHKSFISIRGPHNSSDPLKGYPVLFTRSTQHLEGQVRRLTTDVSDPDYASAKYKSYMDILPFDFSIQNNAYSEDPAQNGYRKVIISLLPGLSDRGEKVFYLTLKIQHETFVTTIVEDFIFYEEKNIRYKEINKSYITTPSRDVIADILFKTPSTLKMAFTASTGAAYQAHYVRNIGVTLPFSPITADDLRENLCYSCGTSSIVVFYNDLGYKSNIYTPGIPSENGNEYLNYDTFRFKVYDPATGQYIKTPNPYEHTIAHLGTFKYVNTGDVSSHVTFTPDPAVVASGIYPTEAVIHYDIKNKNPLIATDEYRSNTSKITLKFNPQKQKKYLIVNGDYRGL